MTAKRVKLVGDFETTTNPDDCRVWLYGLCELDDSSRFSVGTSIEHFCGIVSKQDSIVYFHNLKFDGVFIADHLFREGYKHTTAKRPRSGEFTSLISRQGQWYQLIVHWFSGTKTEFRDSLKKLPMSVKRIAKSFSLPVQKGEIDYDKPRLPGYTPTPDEVEYVKNDVGIVASALALQEKNSKGRLTVGADALAEYKALIGEKTFRGLFPILDVNVDANIRSAYRGGWTYVDRRRQMKVLGCGKVYDVNSLYPYIMYTELLPYGFPEYFESEPEPTKRRPLWVASMTFEATIKPGHLPVIPLKNTFHFSATEYIESTDGPVTLTLTNVDWELWSAHYNIDVHSWNGGFRFIGAIGLFEAYIDKWMAVKMESEGGLREIAKLHLNSLYGKFATNPDITGKKPVFEDDRVRLVTGDIESREPVYTPIGVFVTAYARALTIRAAQDHYDTFAYADTDSLHLITAVQPDLDIHPTRLGAWKHEYDFDRAIYARAKAYSELRTDTGEYETRIAGLPRDIAAKLTVDDFYEGASWGGKLVPKIVPGGVILRDTTFTLKL